MLEASGPIAQSLTTRTRNTWADSRRELAFRNLLRDPPARTRSEHRRVYSERGIRVMRALQILSETLFLSFLLPPPLCIASEPPRPRRASPVYSFDESEKRPAIRHRGTVRSASLLALHQHSAFHEREAWLKYHPARSAGISRQSEHDTARTLRTLFVVRRGAISRRFNGGKKSELQDRRLFCRSCLRQSNFQMIKRNDLKC